MEIVERAELSVVGVEVVADFAYLSTAVPAAWSTLFSRHHELPAPPDGAFVEVSFDLGQGRYREVVGVAVDGDVPTPEAMTVDRVPSGPFLHHRHEGPVTDIAAGFAAMYAWAADTGVQLGPRKVDIGYRMAAPDAAHDLYIDVLD